MGRLCEFENGKIPKNLQTSYVKDSLELVASGNVSLSSPCALTALPVLSFYHFDLDLCCKRDRFAMPQIRLEDLISHLDGVTLGRECHATSQNVKNPLLV